MTKVQTISELQKRLKDSIVNAVQSKVAEICYRVVRDNLIERVYWNYIPQGESSYDRTYELMDSITVGNVSIGTKNVYFEIFMDTDKIHPYETDSGEWNQHQSMGTNSYDTSEYIPMWVEEGTEGSLWDREGAHYMEQSWIELSSGSQSIVKALAKALKSEGWNVKSVN